MKSVIICEKPDLCMTVVKALYKDNFKRYNGYFEGDKYIVTFQFGHLMELMSLDEHKGRSKTKWNLEELPFKPEEFKFKVKEDTKKQYKIIEQLLLRNDVDTVVHTGDADREGTVLVSIVIDNIFKNNNINKRVLRLWLPEQTEESIRNKMQSLDSMEKHISLYNEGLARTYIDYLIGINYTTGITVKSGQKLRVGRVIVPIVKFIYDRYLEQKNFSTEKFFKIATTFEKDNEIIKAAIKDLRFKERLKAQEIYDRIKGNNAIVKNIDIKEVKKEPSKLFSLDKLQNKMGNEYKLSAIKTLAILQGLYEKGYVTYPRTNTEYLDPKEEKKFKSVVEMFAQNGYNVKFHNSKKIFDSSKIESHSALTPTKKIPNDGELSKAEQVLYDVIKNRFLANFYNETPIVEETTVYIEILDEYLIEIKGQVIKRKGFLELESNIKDKVIPSFKIGEELKCNYEIEEGKTQAPKNVTIEELNNFLANPYKEILKTEDEVYKSMLDGIEIGTVGTRAGIIENAKQNDYIVEKKGIYLIGNKGIYLIETLDKLGIDIYKDKTIEISKTLKRIYRNEISINEALDIIFLNISSQINNIKSANLEKFVQEREIIGKCPRCKENVYESKSNFYCDGFRKEQKCNFVLKKEDKFFTSKGKKITKKIAKDLLSKGKVNVTKLNKKSGVGTYNATIILDDNGKFINFKMEFNK
jgi:DNA topoisomerase III